MAQHLLFLTGRLAEKQLHRVLESMAPTPFTYEVRQMGLSVAALLTGEMIQRRLTEVAGFDQIILPGRCRANLETLSQHFGLPVVRGPDEVNDLPRFFGQKQKAVDLTRTDVLLFAEIVDAPRMSVEAVVQRALECRRDGADVIDLGCLPETPFPTLEECVKTLKAEGFRVSVDSMQTEELVRGGKAGADYLLSLHQDSLWVLNEVESTPILIPAKPGDMASLYQTIERVSELNREFLADPILDPIHFGFTESLLRYHQLRQDFPEVPILMGIGNLTELTDADTAGINALLFGIISELKLNAVLATEVSSHAKSALREANLARRIMFAAREQGALPRQLSENLMVLHEKSPWPNSGAEIRETAASVKDPNFRVQVADEGIHVYNRDGLQVVTDPFAAWPDLKLEQDGSHAFYLGVQMARAQIAWELGKRFVQDRPLNWGLAGRPAPVADEACPTPLPSKDDV
jgi:dihydropteroate synthase-like protein